MRISKLPNEVKELLWKHGLAGRRIYVPTQPSPNLITRHLPLVLMEVEETYHDDGITFYFEKSSRDRFSGKFGKSRIAARYGLKVRTAASLSLTAWKAWRDWVGHKERLHLDRLRDLAREAGIEYGSLFFTYLAIRKQLRKGEEVLAHEHSGYHQVQPHVIQQVIELAQASIEGCPWRSA